MPLNAADLQTFSRVARCDSFRDAAKQLGVTRSAISKSIGRLEQSLGVALLNRNTRTCSLTEAGRRVLEHANDVDKALDSAAASVIGAEQDVAGHLAVGMSTSLGATLAPALITYFRRDWPQLKLSVQYDDSYVDLIGCGLDVAIRVAPRLEDSSLMSQRLCQTRRVLVASPNYLVKYGTPRHPRDLKAHRCLEVGVPNRPQAIWRFRDSDDTIEVPIQCSMTANSRLPLIMATCMGDGILYTQEALVAGELARGQLEPILTEYVPTEPWGIYAVYPGRKPAAKVRAFIDFVKAELPNLYTVDRWAPFDMAAVTPRVVSA